MSWVKLAVLALELVGDFVRWVEREKVRTEAERAILARARETIDANIQRAEAARARVRAELDADPGKLRDPDDPYRRKD